MPPFLPGVTVTIAADATAAQIKHQIVECLYNSGRHGLADLFRTDTLTIPLLEAAKRYVNIEHA